MLTNYQLIAYNSIIGGLTVSLKIISTRGDVESFLITLKEILTSQDFDINTDLDILLKKKHESPTDPYTTENTMLALDFDRSDVMHQLMALEVAEYIETYIDDKDNTLPPFFAFGKSIKNKDVYIKAKIRDRKNCKVFCVSFHFARFPFTTALPYI